MRRKILILALAVLQTLVMTGCSASKESSKVASSEISSETQEKSMTEPSHYRVSIASSTSLDFPEEYICEDGSVLEIAAYPDGVLGDDWELLRGCQSGSISIFKGGASVGTDVVPELALLSIPELFPDYNYDSDLTSKDLIDWYQPYYQAQGLAILNLKIHSMGAILSSIPLENRSDLTKLHIRSMSNSYHQIFWSSLGAKVTLIPFNELGYQLQKKEINALEGGMTAIENAGYTPILQNQNFDYVIRTNHSMAVGNVVMNLEEYNSLPPAVQKALQKLSADSWQHEMSPVEYAEKHGLTIIDPNEEIQQALNEGRETIIQELENSLGKKKVREFLDFINTFK
ncbi:MAG: TRAP transporter substrate-binding protein DctP [Clostridiales bacterium]|nr:TRAP transporter substrate-binding protein DctP [Clostridiales bacterium]